MVILADLVANHWPSDLIDQNDEWLWNCISKALFCVSFARSVFVKGPTGRTLLEGKADPSMNSFS